MSNSTPCFILSCERSGSTLLRYLVDSHSEICCPGEICVGQLCFSMRVALGRTMGLQAHDSASAIGSVTSATRDFIDSFMNQHAAYRGKRTWCEKSPINLLYLQDLVRVFGDARYVLLVRDARSVVRSCLRVLDGGQLMEEHRDWIHRFPKERKRAMVVNWTEKNLQLLELEKHLPVDQTMRVRYEDLVDRPEPVLRTLFEFLDVRWEPVASRAFEVEHDPGGGDDKIRRTRRIENNGPAQLDLSSVPADDIARMNVLLRDFGYAPYRDGASAPEPVVVQPQPPFP